MRAAIVDAAEEIDRLFRDLDHEDRGAGLGRMRLEAVLEFQPGQVAGQQEIALDGADIHRALGGDLRAVVGEEVAIAGELRRPLDRLDVAFHHLEADDRAVGIELLGGNDRPRQHVAVAAVFGGDASGKVIDLLERDLAAEEVGVELAELRVGVDRGAHDLDPTNDEQGFAGARRGFDAGDRDGGAAGLGQRHRRPLESLALPARLVAGRNDLCTRQETTCATAANDTLNIAKAAAIARTPASVAPTPAPMQEFYGREGPGSNRGHVPSARPRWQFFHMFQ